MSMMRMLSAILFVELSEWPFLFLDIQMPLVVCFLSVSDMTPNSVPNKWLSRVDFPVDWEPKTEMRW